MTTKIIDHPLLRRIKGSLTVTTFTNLQYGHILYDRFNQSEVHKHLAPAGDVYDATKSGYLYAPCSISRLDLFGPSRWIQLSLNLVSSSAAWITRCTMTTRILVILRLLSRINRLF